MRANGSTASAPSRSFWFDCLMEFIVTQRRGWLMQGSGSNFVQGVELLLLELGRREKKKDTTLSAGPVLLVWAGKPIRMSRLDSQQIGGSFSVRPRQPCHRIKFPVASERGSIDLSSGEFRDSSKEEVDLFPAPRLSDRSPRSRRFSYRSRTSCHD